MHRPRLAPIIIPLLVLAFAGHAEGVGFRTARTYSTGENSPAAAVVQDFNHDGIPDIATANYVEVSVLLGKAEGGFSAPVAYPTDTTYTPEIQAADLNGDGNLDLAVSNGADSVEIFLGNGDGSFQSPQIVEVGQGVSGLQIADFDGDGQPDLAVATYGDNGSPGAVAILLGHGDGTFSAPTFNPVAYGAQRLAVADFNADGKLDLAVASASGGQVLLGNGDGTFQRETTIYPAGRDVAAGDVNGDGKIDLAWNEVPTGQIFGGQITVTLGNGDGTFQGGTSHDTTSYYIQTLRLADANGDGRLDLVASGTGAILLLGNGDGTFANPIIYAVGYSFAEVADLNRDGHSDLIAGGRDLIGVAYGRANGSFLAPAEFSPLLGYTSAFVTADFNGDGNIDLAIEGESGGVIALGDGKGNFALGSMFSAIGRSFDLLVGDFNNDSKLDLVLWDSTYTYTYLGNGDGTFAPAKRTRNGGAPVLGVVGDFNSDGNLDLATANEFSDKFAVLLGHGDGTFDVTTYAASKTPEPIASADFNLDGKLDLVVGNSFNDSIGVYLGNGDGTFQADAIRTTVFSPVEMVTADLNKDGKPDLVVNASILLGNGDGTFQAPRSILTGARPQLADFNYDGNIDLFTIGDEEDLEAALGNGDGTFRKMHSYYIGGALPGELRLSDVNNDGILDALTSVDGGNVVILLGRH